MSTNNKLETLIELSRLEKNRRNRLEDKLRKHKYYVELGELFYPSIETIKIKNEQNFFIANQTLEALEDNTKTLKFFEFPSFLQSATTVKAPSV